MTARACTHTVSRADCAALSVAYSTHSAGGWEAFARLVLDAGYEATLRALQS